MAHSNEIPFLHGAPFAPVVRFALPVAATGVFQLLFNAADIIVVGRFAGNDCLAAVGATTSLISLLISAFTGVSVGVNILIARLLGSGQPEQANEAAHCALSLNRTPSRGQRKNIKFFRSAAKRCWPFFMRRGKAHAFPSASARPDYAGHVLCCNSEYTAGSSEQARACW